ncbi:DNA methyltransferase [Helicobacter monodelphidis]|uniref:type ISP restriction/modification enzyme n=1 Tax=Helicobacter sp. 15-1451 TaxID=2004995 RepID=UPI000DCE77BB|nr:type ISP restriction/modification enzyme [Helicobacter sp. 15-1451]RAX57804.1 DNA methyltransferase [Helicobacter sp. 15-1451]
MEFLGTYLNTIQNITLQDKEHTHRTYLQNFLNSIKEALATNNKALSSLTIRHEPNNDKEGRGAPDFMILFQGLSIGYIENKRVNTDLDSVVQSEQIEKYLQLNDNLILTDYLHFCRVCKNEKNKAQIVQGCRICELSQIKATLKSKQILESKTQELLDFFKIFFDASKIKPIITASEFAQSLALRTQILKATLIENIDNMHIANLYETFKTQLYQELDFNDFCDSFAQTLTYSLFLAKLNITEDKELDLYNAKKFIPKSFPLIRAMSDFLNQLEDLDSIKWLLEEIIHISNHIDIASIIRELNQMNEKDLLGNYTTAFTHKDPYLHFYETFLSKYDPKLREIRGVYYTPISVVSFIINAIDFILKADFALPKGLSASLENQNITLLDFATGTGTFLLESFRKALEPTSKNSPKYDPKNLLNKFFGFEFLIAPYIIAHLRLSQSFKEEFNTPIEDNERLGIYLTNTLYSKDIKAEQNEKANLFGGIPELVGEAIAAQKTKEKEILIITGNPPYNGASANKGLYEKEVRNTYKKPLEILGSPVTFIKNGKIEKEKNPKWLLDDYVKFICFAESKIQKQGSGIFAFISNNSFLDNPTFRGMRYSLLNTFDKIYILDLHGNARKKELCPDGSKDDNVFDIMQGVSINVFVKHSCHSSFPIGHSEAKAEESKKHSSKDISAFSKPQYDKAVCHSERSEESKTKKPLASVYHYNLYGKRKDKYNFLYENTLDSIKWSKLSPKKPFYLFIPQNESLREEYDKGWSVKDIFRISGVGICSKRDNIVFHNTKESLKVMLKDFITKSKEELYRIYNIGEDSRDWKLDSAIESIKENKDNLDDFIMQCHYRPFDYRWTYYINKSRAFMAYPVYEVFQHFLDNDNVALLASRQSSAVGDDKISTIAISDKMVDLNFYRRGGEEVMPLYLKNEDLQSNRIENFTQEFRDFIDSKYQWDNEDYKNNPEFFIITPCHSEAKAEESKKDSNKEIFRSAQYDKEQHNNHKFTLTPEAILGYIYAVLFHKDYREKYLDFLKIDFPKIPFVESKEKFLILSALGQKLISVHLMQDSATRERERERESRK